MNSSVWLFLLLLLFWSAPCTQHFSIPEDWEKLANRGNLLYSQSIPQDAQVLPYVGNGYIASVIYSDSIYAAGVYVGTGILGITSSRRARIPSTINNLLNAKNFLLKSVGGAINFETATYFNRSAVFSPDYDAAVASLEQRWYAHRRIRSCLVYQVDIDNTANNKSLTLSFGGEGVSPFHSKDIDFQQKQLSEEIESYEGKVVRGETDYAQEVRVAVIFSKRKEITVNPRSKATVILVSIIRSSLDSQDPIADAYADYKLSTSLTPAELYDTHVQEWQRLWNGPGGGIEIEGHAELAAQVNSSLYYILSSVRNDWPWPASPASLGTSCYNGHCFWDNEIWVLPSLMILHPDIAHQSFQFRYSRLDEAVKYAKAQGHKGAQYPWQQAFTGHEVDMFPMFNKLEQHISSAIAFATRQYFYHTKDLDWLKTIAFPMLQGIAEFWSSRVKKENSTSGPGYHYSIHYVVPPDEFAIGFPLYEGVHNNPYTNYITKLSLQFAYDAAMQYLKVEELQAEAEVWKDVADNMLILFDQQHLRHPEYEGFPKGNIYFLEKVKQADVVLLYYPLELFQFDSNQTSGVNPNRTILLNDLLFYEPKTDFKNGPAMSLQVHSIAWLLLNNLTLANQRLYQSLNNIQKPFNVWTETPNPKVHPMDLGCYQFITGAGGFLQSIINGYVGLRVREDEIFLYGFRGFPYDSVKSITLRNIKYQGESITLQLTTKEFVFERHNPSMSKILFVQSVQSGKTIELREEKIAVPNGDARLYFG